jgi:hypothetical protein
MMQVMMLPQFNDQVEAEYRFEGEIVTIIINGQQDIFDFSGMPEGALDYVDTELPYDPIISAKREEGILYVEIINFINHLATEEEKYPDWVDSSTLEEVEDGTT